MEVKINKEIRNYTESMFFWTVPQTVHFFCPCLWHGGGFVFPSLRAVRDGRICVLGHDVGDVLEHLKGEHIEVRGSLISVEHSIV